MAQSGRQFNILKERLFGYGGELSAKFREGIHDFITKHEPVDMEADVKTWVEKVDQASYKTLDREVDSMIEKGYSESEIFEITVLSAFSAAETRLNLALEFLNQEDD